MFTVKGVIIENASSNTVVNDTRQGLQLKVAGAFNYGITFQDKIVPYPEN